MRHAELVRMVHDVYREAVSSPDSWSAARAAEWAEDAFVADPPDRETAKHLRQVIRISVKLAEFWRDPAVTARVDRDDWRARVDIALGARAWRPVLELARAGLTTEASPELFDEVKALFRLVHNDRWMDGVSYDEWLEAGS